MFKVLKININNQLNFSRIVEVVVSLLVSILFGSFGENPYYVVQLLPTKSNESLGLSTVFIPLAMRVISCLSELIFRAYLHFSDPHANSSVFITTSSILFLTFSHLISFFTGIAILIFKLPFDKGIVSMGIFLTMKSFFFPFFILWGSNGVVTIIKEDVVYFFAQINDLKVRVHDLYSKLISLFQSNQIQPLNEWWNQMISKNVKIFQF